MLKNKFIELFSSNVGSPLLFVEKSYGSLDHASITALEQGYSSFNYPIPIELTIAKAVEKACVFSKMDLKDAFNQIWISPGQ